MQEAGLGTLSFLGGLITIVPENRFDKPQRENGIVYRTENKKVRQFWRWVEGQILTTDPTRAIFDRSQQGIVCTQSDVRNAISEIDNAISGFAHQLALRGLRPEPRSPLAAMLDYYRYQLGAELVRNMHGDFDHFVAMPDFSAIPEKYADREVSDYRDPFEKPRDLPATRYGFRDTTIGSKQVRVYNTPLDTAANMILKQGRSLYQIQGDCGVVSCANIAIMSGILGMNEERALDIAMHCGNVDLNLNSILPGNRGATCADSREAILNHMGIPSSQLPCVPKSESTMNALQAAVIEGRGVIVSVDVERFWQGTEKGGHAVTLLSVSEDGQTFYVMDTGIGGMHEVSREQLSRSLSGRPANVTLNIIR